jgi:sulfite reductase alpha subunit-like flavoprotein
LGDDRSPGGGHEAALDPWLARELWPALGCGGGESGEVEKAARLLPPPRFCIAVVAEEEQEEEGDARLPPLTPEERAHAEAAAAAGAFRAMAAAAEARAAEAALGKAAADAPVAATTSAHGPWRPLMAPLVASRRLTSASHFQDTRHLEFDLSGYDREDEDASSFTTTSSIYEPGDVLAVFPRQEARDVAAVLAACGLTGRERLRVSATEAAASPAMEASARAVVAGVLDVSSAAPRRHLWEVLAAHADEVASWAAAAAACDANADADSAAPSSSALPDPLSPEMARQRAERLALFASAAGREDAARYAWGSERRGLAEVLRDFFPSAAADDGADATSAAPRRSPTLSLARLLEACPRLQPRMFSLASSPRAHGPRAAHVLAALVSWRSPTRRPVRGLATGWLASLQPPADGAAAAAAAAPPPRVPVWIERAETLRQPADLSVPLLLIGPGTGVAPFRAILHERAALAAAAAEAGAPAPAPCHLFFGCRSPDADFYYRDEWPALVESGALARDRGLITAFSRLGEAAAVGGDSGEAATAATAEPPPLSSAPRQYVTHRLRENADLVWDLIERRGAHVLVSGSAARMPSDVADALADVAGERLAAEGAEGGAVAAAAAATPSTERRAAGRAWVKALEARGRFRVEAWS